MKRPIEKNRYRSCHPKLTFLLTSIDKKGKENVMALAWATPISEEPPLVAIAVGKESLTARNIHKTKEFVLNVPNEKLLSAIWICGTKSGREMDKFRQAKLTKEKAKFVKPPYIKECLGHIECRVKKIVDAGECFLFIGEMVYLVVESNAFRNFWQPSANVVLHFGGKKFTTPR